jgi:hypothetical protein
MAPAAAAAFAVGGADVGHDHLLLLEPPSVM